MNHNDISRLKPYIKKVFCDQETPISIFNKLGQKYPYAFLLESAEVNKTNGRYSFIGFDPLQLFIFPTKSTTNPLDILRNAFEKINYQPNKELPPLQAGFVGYFSYELVRHFEKISLTQDGATIPEGIFFLPKKMLIFDHFEHTLTLVAYSEETLTELLFEFKNLKNLPHPENITETFYDNKNHENSPENFISLVEIAQEKIKAGEVFQVVLSQEFKQKTDLHPFDLYRKLRLRSPSPYMYYLQYPDFSIVGSSPETLIKTEGNEMILRPIAGTRPRGKDLEEDQKLAEELKNDAKEVAEHLMLVDLGRNDLGRVAQPGTVKVIKLMEVEKYAHVMHLVSEIRALSNKNQSLFNIFRSAFPAGTLTGAPKVRAMEIIANLETEPREIYGGAVGYFDLSNNMDFAIAIRTMLYKDHTATIRAGAGIVYDSLPKAENLECFNKAKGPLNALKA